MSKSNRKSLSSGSWIGPGETPRQISARVSRKPAMICCQKQRLLVVTILLSAFVLIAFFVFGHACYKIGAREPHNEIEVEHLKTSSCLHITTRL